jgi:DNA-binding NarL/FixJ family response regulator
MTDLSQPGSAQPAPRRAGSGPTVLVVEDEDPLRSAIRRLLQTEGYAVLEAQNGAMGLELLSGFTTQLMDMRLVSPQLAFLAKPFRNDDLLATIGNQLGRASIARRNVQRTDPKGS